LVIVVLCGALVETVGLTPATGTAPADADVAPPATTDSSGFEANTNLTQISDWLTKTIVGVGLVEARQPLTWFGNTAQTLGQGLIVTNNSEPVGPVVAGSIMVFFSVSGFLCGYNLTQLFLARALAHGNR
jgi:hypothetical protein